jgi:hypothetical protein
LENVPIVKAATAYDNLQTGETFILILGQALYMGEHVESTLLCPNQLRYNGVEVDDCPKHLAPPNKPSTHSIFIPESQLRLPLCLKGPISLFDSRSPTQYELEHCKWVHLTNDEVWDPHSTEQLQDNEERVEHVRRSDDYERCIYALNGRTNPFSDITNLLEDGQILKTMQTDIRKPETPP